MKEISGSNGFFFSGKLFKCLGLVYCFFLISAIRYLFIFYLPICLGCGKWNARFRAWWTRQTHPHGLCGRGEYAAATRLPGIRLWSKHRQVENFYRISFTDISYREGTMVEKFYFTPISFLPMSSPIVVKLWQIKQSKLFLICMFLPKINQF